MNALWEWWQPPPPPPPPPPPVQLIGWPQAPFILGIFVCALVLAFVLVRILVCSAAVAFFLLRWIPTLAVGVLALGVGVVAAGYAIETWIPGGRAVVEAFVHRYGTATAEWWLKRAGFLG